MRRALLASLLLEILALWGLVVLIGWGWTLLALLACIPIGFAIMRSAGEDAFADLRAGGPSGLQEGRGSRHALRFAAGLLIAIPGPVSTLLGIGLLTPPGRALAVRVLGSRFAILRVQSETGFPTGPFAGGGDVVPGTVVPDPETRQEPSRSPELDS